MKSSNAFFVGLMIAVLSVLSISPLWASTFTMDTQHTQIGFKVKHMTIAYVRGRFDRFQGSFTYDPKDLKASHAEIRIQAASIDTGSTARDKDLRSAAFLWVQKYPWITFTSTKVIGSNPKKFNLLGKLTIHGVTHIVQLHVQLGGQILFNGKEQIAFHASTLINRKHYGIIWNKILDNGGFLIGNHVYITLEVQGYPSGK